MILLSYPSVLTNCFNSFYIKAGDPKFLEEALKFAYGKDSAALKDGRIQGVQALSGTGGLRVMGELLAKHGHKEIYVPNPTWGNHKAIFTVRLPKYFSILFFFLFCCLLIIAFFQSNELCSSAF